jgi:hypothetical protein
VTYLSVDLAIFERLVGAPLDSNGRPRLDTKGVPINRILVAPPLSTQAEEGERLPSYGVRIPELSKARDTKRMLSSKNSNSVNLNDFSRQAFRQVPVYAESIDGSDYQNLWPVVTFYWMDENFNSSTYMYADPILIVDPSAPKVDVRNHLGQVIASGQTRVKYLSHPDPVDLIYAIRVWSKDLVELRLICEAVKRLFPARGVLEVEQWNGQKVPYDMLQEGVDNFDVGGGEIAETGEGEQRGYSRAFVYRVEAYSDNTIDTQAMWVEDTVRNRILELANKQGVLAENVGSVDLLEVDELSYQGGIRVQVQKP